MKTLEELLADGYPDVLVHALGLYDGRAKDSRYERLLLMLRLSTNEYTRRLQRPHQDQERLKRDRFDLIDRISAFISLLKIGDFSIAEDQLPSPVLPLEEQKKEVPLLLFLGSNPKSMGQLQLEKEYAKVHHQLQDKSDIFSLRYEPVVSRETFAQILADRQPAIIHFSGHGLGEATDFRKAGLVFQDANNRHKGDVVSAVALADIIGTYKKAFPIRLVVLNACESTGHAREISRRGLYAIGMTEEVLDRRAIVFAAGFYRGLALKPDDIPFAFGAALDAFGIADVEGGAAVPKLFLDGQELGGEKN
jgi:hypothetical protein